jgi:hypothetical protein
MQLSKSNQLHSMKENVMYELLLTRGWVLVEFYSAHNLLNFNVYSWIKETKGVLG